jgi:hypothetical protein
MGITLDHLLGLVGRLDDGGGFDSPRERFRRFLIEQETSGHIGRTLLDQCPPLIDEQHHRAVQDLVVLLGRSLGFDTTFGTYSPAGGLNSEGYWRSRGRLDVVLELRTNHTSTSDIESLVRSMSAHAATARAGSQARVIGLAVLLPGYPGRRRLEESLAAAKLGSTVRLVSLRSLLFLSDSACAGRSSHEDVVRLFDTVASPDFVVGLIEQHAHGSQPEFLDLPNVHPTFETGPACWLATVDGDGVITAERFLEVVIGKRRIFGVRGAGHPSGVVHAGDRICFYLPDRGVVGRADVKSIESKGAGLRDVNQYTQLLRLDNLELYPEAPLVPEAETMLRLRAAQGDASPRWHPLMRISDQIFESLTSRENQERVTGTPSQERGDIRLRRALSPKGLSDGGSRSRE